MPDLLLPSLEIQNFRAFEHLRIERLGRVNLITGKNNVGKTSLLEALYLYARGGSPRILRELLRGRDELRKRSTFHVDSDSNDYEQTSAEDYERAFDVRHLFSGRKAIIDIREPIRVGRLDAGTKVASVRLMMDEAETSASVPRIETISSNGVVSSYAIDRLSSISIPYRTPPGSINCQFLKAQAFSTLSLSRMWSRISVELGQDSVLEPLRIIVPTVERIGFVDEDDDSIERVAMIKTVDMKEPVPLRSLGEGVNRLFGIALSLVSAKDGILLIDEVETGLHYSVMPDVWRLIFQVAQRMNVQVFATTHSWDCIEAFERATREEDNADGELIHLVNKRDKVLAVLYDEEELGVVTQEMIEVR